MLSANLNQYGSYQAIDRPATPRETRRGSIHLRTPPMSGSKGSFAHTSSPYKEAYSPYWNYRSHHRRLSSGLSPRRDQSPIIGRPPSPRTFYLNRKALRLPAPVTDIVTPPQSPVISKTFDKASTDAVIQRLHTQSCAHHQQLQMLDLHCQKLQQICRTRLELISQRWTYQRYHN